MQYSYHDPERGTLTVERTDNPQPYVDRKGRVQTRPGYWYTVTDARGTVLMECGNVEALIHWMGPDTHRIEGTGPQAFTRQA